MMMKLDPEFVDQARWFIAYAGHCGWPQRLLMERFELNADQAAALFREIGHPKVGGDHEPQRGRFL
jgi:hypothetical protein